MLQTEGGILYTGITTDVTRRVQQHGRGQGAKALRGKGPLQLVYQTPAATHSAALQLEWRVKRLTRSKKLSLVRAQPTNLDGWLMAITAG